jgi:prepilin-type N-terminal cleavage/methylation domain-containing protein
MKPITTTSARPQIAATFALNTGTVRRPELRVSHGGLVGQRGFTLIELLTVIAVISLLASWCLTALTQAQAHARRAACLSQLHQIGAAMHGYAAENGNQLPWEKTAASSLEPDQLDCFAYWLALSNELSSAKILRCAGDRRCQAPDSFGELVPADVSYTLCEQSRGVLSQSIVCTDRFLADYWITEADLPQAGWAPSPNTGHGSSTGNVLCADGSARTLNDAGLRQALRLHLSACSTIAVEFLRSGL